MQCACNLGLAAVMAFMATGVSATPPDSAWREIAPYFNPPTEYAGQFGAYRSPLLFKDATTVKTAADWDRRREEIKRTWHEYMGPWPPILENPKVEYLYQTNNAEYGQWRVRLQIAPDQSGEGWLMIPPGKRPFPAVLVCFYEPETSVGLGKKPLRDFARQLTKRGFVTLSIGTPGGNAWLPQLGSAQCQPLSFHAYVAANCWQVLAHHPSVNSNRIGIVGHSYGGKWAMFGACLYERFACGVWSDPGIVFDESRAAVNYWEPWYLGLDPVEKRKARGLITPDNPRTGAYRRMREAGLDLHELQSLMAPRPFLVSGGAEDSPARWVALNHVMAVNQVLGSTNRVAMTNRQLHEPNDESNAAIYAFFECFLK